MKLMSLFRTFLKHLRNLWVRHSGTLPLGSLMILGLAISSGCTPKLIAVKTDPCAGWAPIFISKQDVLTDLTAKSILSHDLHGVQAGCWKAPEKQKK